MLHAAVEELKNMQSGKNKAKANPANTELREIEAAKTNRLRALRLAKEAEEREAAAKAAAAAPPKLVKRRTRSASAGEQPGPG